MGKSEQRELASRMAVLLFHLLKWQYQPARQGASLLATIKTQRERVKRRLRQTPSLENCLKNPDLWADAWDGARDTAEKETGIAYEKFPEQCPSLGQVAGDERDCQRVIVQQRIKNFLPQQLLFLLCCPSNFGEEQSFRLIRGQLAHLIIYLALNLQQLSARDQHLGIIGNFTEDGFDFLLLIEIEQGFKVIEDN
ncbi:hypothetical protein LDFHOB_04385 [Candidatus Electronema aureum]